MANKEVVICSPVRTAIGTYGGTLKDMPAVDLGAVAVRATLERAKLVARRYRHGRHGQRDSGWQQNEPGPAGGHQWRHSGRCSGADGQPRLWLGCASDCERGTGGDARIDR